MSELDNLIEAVEAGRATDLQFHTWRPGLTGTIKESKTMWRAYHGSLDAAHALHEALLPGWGHSAGFDGVQNFSDVFSQSKPTFTVFARTPARAWLIAILRAYRSVQA